MNPLAFLLFVASILFCLASAVPNMEYCMPIANYMVLIAILVEVASIQEKIKEE